MDVIKTNAAGAVITRGGLPSCTCCCASVDCTGLWGPGYDSLPGEVYVANNTGTVLVDENLTHYRAYGSKCQWHSPSHNSQVVYVAGCMWTVSAHEVFPSPVAWIGYKKGQFSDGPLGQYFSNSDGLTGTVYYTVT